jgi:starch synthase
LFRLETSHICVQITAEVDEVKFGYHHKVDDGVDFVFVDHPSFQRPGGLYGDAKGNYGDNQWRFKLLCQAALEAPLRLPLNDKGVYGQECIFVANGMHHRAQNSPSVQRLV